MPSRSTRLSISALMIVLLMLLAVPAGATHSAQHAEDQIGEVAAQGRLDMDAVVASFETEISSMTSEAEVEVAEDEADDSIVAIWSVAKKAIEDLVKLYPGDLGSIGADAKQQILQKRNETRTEIANLAGAWVAPPPVTTTSTTTTTTTVAQSTTTTTIGATVTTVGGVGVPPGSGSNSGNGGGGNGGNTGNGGNAGNGGNGGNGGNTGNAGNGGNGPGGQPNSEAGPAAPGAGTIETVIDSSVSNDLMVIAQTPAQTDSSASDIVTAGDAGVMSRVSGMLETVLPPAIVDLVLSPLLILEILLRTSLADGQRIVVPLSMLAVCAVLIALTDRLSKRTTRAMRLVRS